MPLCNKPVANARDSQETARDARSCGKNCNMISYHFPRSLRVLVVAFWLCFSSVARAQTTLPPETENRLRALLSDPRFADAQIGVCVENLGVVENAQSFPSQNPDAPQSDVPQSDAPPMLFSQNVDKRFLPASNMKLFTASIALESLGENRTFATCVARSSTRSKSLYLIGGGDPSLTIADLRNLAQAVRKSGIKKVNGVFADASLFGADSFGGRYPDGWTLDDALWYYGPEVSALALERNQIDITITGTEVGKAPRVEVSPQLAGFDLKEIVCEVRTVAKPTVSITFDRADGKSAIGAKLWVRGEIAPAQVVTEGVAIPNVAEVVAQTFARELRAAGVRVRGKIGAQTLPNAPHSVIAQHESAPLKTLVQRFLKKSDNLYGEMFLRAAGTFPNANANANANATSSTRSDGGGLNVGSTSSESVSNGVSSLGAARAGHLELLRWLQSQKVSTASLRLSDGSGLSRYNLLTPRAIVELLRVENTHNRRAFWDALPIAGVDGTLANRMKNTAAQNNARAKTGTFSIASCLSGFVTTRDNRRLAVSVLTNFVRDGNQARRLQNDIFVALADASWK